MSLDIFQPNLNITSSSYVSHSSSNFVSNSPTNLPSNPARIKPQMESPVDFKNLSDEKLTEYLGSLFHKEKQIGDSILMVLKEIKSRRIYAALGYSSIFEMLVKHFHLSETSSYQRLNALKLMESVPSAAKEIFKGDLSLTNAAAVQSFIYRSEKEKNKPMSVNEKTELITAVKNKSTKEAQQILAAINPAAVVPKQKEKIITDQFTQLQILVDQDTLSQLKQVQCLLSHKIPDGDYNQILKWMTAEMLVVLQKRKGIYNHKGISNMELVKNKAQEKTVTIHTDAEKENNKIQNQESYNKNNINNFQTTALVHETEKSSKMNEKSSQMTRNSPPLAGKQSVVKLDLKQDQDQESEQEKIQNQEPNRNENNFRNSIQIRNQNLIKNNDNDNDNLQKTNQLIKTFSRYIFAETKKKIFNSANNRCQYISADGQRCNSQHQLEVDHIKPISQGGNNDANNLQLLCRTHNQYRTKQTHGFWYTPKDPNRFMAFGISRKKKCLK